MKVEERLLKYISYWTTSDENNTSIPTSDREFALARELEQELHSLGLSMVTLTDHCYVYGLLPATAGMVGKKSIGFIAHMDTAPDYSGENVKPQIIPDYDGKDVLLKGSGAYLKVSDFPTLAGLKGRTLITTDGTTLLGADDKAGIKDVFYLLFRVGPVFVTFILFLGVYTMSQVQSTMGAYYINYYANRGDMLSWFSMIMMLFSVIGVPCVPALTKKLHKKGTVMFGLGVAGLGCLILYFMPTTAIVGMMAARAITGFGYGILMGIVWSVVTDPVEYADWKTGKRYTAIVMTLIGLGIKFSMVIGGSLPTAVLESTGYVAGQVQNEATMTAIRMMTTLLPLAAVVVAMVVYGLFYHLNEEKIRQIQAEIAERNAKRDAK